VSLLLNPRCCISLILLIALVVCGCIVGSTLITLAGQPNAIRTSLDTERVNVAANEQFTVTLTIENVDVDKVTINSIGLDGDLTDGATLVSMSPAYREVKEQDYPVFGKWTQYTLDQTLLGGDKLEVTLTFQAGQAGSYSGYIAAWVQRDFMGVAFEQARRESIKLVVQ
jgi:hypothetical protein